MKLKCKRCEYEWDYNGDAEWYASCPKCRTTVSLKKKKEEEKVRKTQSEGRVR